MSRVPEDGDPLNMEDIDMIMEAVHQRQTNFPNEDAVFSFGIVMLNIGNRFAVVTCLEQEWQGLKKDIPKGEGVPKCPNGHTLMEGPGLKLGWIADD